MFVDRLSQCVTAPTDPLGSGLTPIRYSRIPVWLATLANFMFVAPTAFAQVGTLQFSQPLYTIAETTLNGEYLTPTMTVTRTGGSAGALTVSYCVWPSDVTDNAVENTNYYFQANTRRWVAAGKLSWADGDSSPKSFTFSYVDQFNQTLKSLISSSTVQGTVTYSARLTNVIGGAALGPDAVSRLEIADAQGPVAGIVNLSARRFYGADGGTGAVISVRRDGGATGSISVNYATSSTLPPLSQNGAVIPAGVAGVNYISTAGTLTWAAGDSAVKTFIVPLPSAGNSNGTMNVAVNLSSPSGGAVIGTVPSALLAIQNRASTVYNINDATDLSTYRVSLPPGSDPVRGILFWFPGTGGDDRHFTTDSNFRKSADQWRFAIVSPKGNSHVAPNQIAFPEPKLAFLFDRLRQIASTTGRSEILNAPLVFSGMSAGAYSTSLGLTVWPERTIAVIAQEGWSALPLDYPGQFNAAQSQIPALNLGGQNDSSQSPPSSIFPALNSYRKNGLTRSANVICWGRPHTFSTFDKYNSFALYWLDQIMAAGRYPPAQAPTASTAPILGALDISSGWWGARNCTNTPNYTLAGGSSSYLAIGSDATFAGIKDVSHPLVDGWFPTESAARAFRAHSSLPTITFSSPAQFASGLVGQAVNLDINLSSYGSGLTKIQFYDGTSILGEDLTPPYHFTYRPTAKGLRGLTAVASNASGPVYTAFTLFIASDPVSLQSFRSVHGLAVDGSQDLHTPAEDGVENLLKFALNMLGTGVGQTSALTTPNRSTLLTDGMAGLPLAGGKIDAEPELTYIRRKASSNPGIVYTVQFSNDLSPRSWGTSPAATESVTSLDSTFERVAVHHSEAAERRFVRVRITN